MTGRRTGRTGLRGGSRHVPTEGAPGPGPGDRTEGDLSPGTDTEGLDRRGNEKEKLFKKVKVVRSPYFESVTTRSLQVSGTFEERSRNPCLASRKFICQISLTLTLVRGGVGDGSREFSCLVPQARRVPGQGNVRWGHTHDLTRIGSGFPPLSPPPYVLTWRPRLLYSST